MNEILKQTYNPDSELYGSGNIDFGHEDADKILKERELEKLAREADLFNDFERMQKNKKEIYIPRFSYELKEFIKKYCKTKHKVLPNNFYHMKKKQLYAIYFNLMA